MPQRATIESIPQAYRMLKQMRAQEVEWGEDYRRAGAEALRGVLEQGMAARVDRHLAEMAERGEADRRNGSYGRWLMTELGEIELRVPRTRRFSALGVVRAYAARAPHIDQMILACFVLGLSTRKVAIALQPVLGRRISPGTVSQVAKLLDGAVAAFHRRPLKDHYPVLMLDGVVLARKTGLGALRRPVLVALGLHRTAKRRSSTTAWPIDLVDFASERNGEREINPARLAAVVETFSDPRYRLGLADVQPDFLGRAYEYLLRKFAEGSGQSAGEFFTPTEVGYLMAHLVRPRPGEDCHDYACGSAGLLIKLQLVARETDPTSRVPLKLSGQELQADSYAVAHMNAIIHDMEVQIERGDTMINPKFKDGAGRIAIHDIVVANPMWNQDFNADIFENDPFDRFRTAGGVTTGKGDWAWLQHTLACLNERGRAAVVLDTGAITRGSGSKNEDRERNIRKWFVDRDLIDGVTLLPENLFYNTTAAGVIIVLSKRKPSAHKGKIVLLNASRRVGKGRPKNFIPEDDIRPLAAMFLKGEPVEGEVAIITREQAAEADYNLSPEPMGGAGGKRR